jgi:carbonic anhydrase/acetyltransferase-like protein (isoleucine patch superfamily)
MRTLSIDGEHPSVHKTAYVAPGAVLVGRVTVGAEASIWFNAVLRGDNEPITIGRGSNVQDGVAIHTDPRVKSG